MLGVVRAAAGSPDVAVLCPLATAPLPDAPSAPILLGNDRRVLGPLGGARDVGGGRRSVNVAAQFLAARIDNPNSPRAATINVAFDIDFHPIRYARFAA